MILKQFLLCAMLSIVCNGCGKSDSKDNTPTPTPEPAPAPETPSTEQTKQTVTDPAVSLVLRIVDGPMAGSQAEFPAGSLAIGTSVEITVLEDQPDQFDSVFAAGVTPASAAALGISMLDAEGNSVKLAVVGTVSIATAEGISLTADAKKENIGVIHQRSDEKLIVYLPGQIKADANGIPAVPFVFGGVFSLAFIGQEVPSEFKVFDVDAPIVATGNEIVSSEVTATGMTLTWQGASDDSSAAESLMYKVLSSTSNNIGSEAEAEASGTVQKDWTANLTTYAVTGLTASTTYYFKVLVRDEAGKISGYPTIFKSTESGIKRMFVTTGTTNGALGGPAGADVKCNADAGKPIGTATWKAFLVDGTTRKACSTASCSGNNEGIDWVLKANTQYIRSGDAAAIGTTNEKAIFPTFPLTSAPNEDESKFFWAGFNNDWTTATDHCNGWTSDDDTNFSGNQGRSVTSFKLLSNAPNPCNEPSLLLCIEQ